MKSWTRGCSAARGQTTSLIKSLILKAMNEPITERMDECMTRAFVY